MAKTDHKSVDAYLADQPAAVRPLLDRVRAAIRKGAPQAKEIISYQMPAYRLPAGIVIFFAGWKKHYAVYPTTEALVAAFADELAPYALSKGTIRFPLTEPVPEALIERLARFRAQEVAERASAKAATKKRSARPA